MKRKARPLDLPQACVPLEKTKEEGRTRGQLSEHQQIQATLISTGRSIIYSEQTHKNVSWMKINKRACIISLIQAQSTNEINCIQKSNFQYKFVVRHEILIFVQAI